MVRVHDEAGRESMRRGKVDQMQAVIGAESQVANDEVVGSAENAPVRAEEIALLLHIRDRGDALSKSCARQAVRFDDQDARGRAVVNVASHGQPTHVSTIGWLRRSTTSPKGDVRKWHRGPTPWPKVELEPSAGPHSIHPPSDAATTSPSER